MDRSGDDTAGRGPEGAAPGRVSAALARRVVRFRHLVVAFWLGGATVAMLLPPSLAGARGLGIGSLIPLEAEAIETEIRSLELFRFPVLGRTAVVQRDPDGLSIEAQARVFQRALRLNRGVLEDVRGIAGALPITNSLGLFPGSRETGTTAITYLFFRPETGVGTRVGLAERLAERYVNGPGDALVGVTGPVPARNAQANLIHDSLPTVEVATVVLIAGIVGVTFRSVGAPVLTLIAAGLAYVISLPLVAWTGRILRISIPEEVDPVIVVLLLGIVTDYSIFFLTGARDRLARGDRPAQAAERTAARFLPIILTAGVAIAAGCAALLVARLAFLRAFGPGLAITVLVGMLVSVTFVPAAMALAGPATFWPRSPARASRHGTVGRERAQTSRSWTAGVARFTTDRRGGTVVLLVSVAVLGVASLELRRADLGFSLIGGLPATAPVSRAADAAARGFPSGILSPTVLVIEGREIGDRSRSLERLQSLIRRQRGVAAVVGPAQLPLVENLGLIVSPNGDAVRYVVILDVPPLSGAGVERLQGLRERMPDLLLAAGVPDARASFAGDTALIQETIERTVDDLGRIAVVTLVLDLVLLALFLRSLVAPIYLLATSVLALLATLGLTVAFFQGFLGGPGITYYVPIAAAVLLVSLGSDYNIFIAGRIWDEARRRDLREAIGVGAGEATEAITIAGITLAASFALLAIVPLVPFRELAFAMSTGILVDSFLVRTFLVPSLVSLAGRVSEWPGRTFFRPVRGPTGGVA